MSFKTPLTGLTENQIKKRKDAGNVNRLKNSASRNFSEIIASNVFTRINAIYSVLFIIVISTGYFLDGLFGILILINSAIGIIQEIRAKRILDNLAIVNTQHPKVIRNGIIQEIRAEDIVIDDLINISSGDQIIVDGEIKKSLDLEVDESMLTGESDNIIKKKGDSVYSGSYVVAGNAYFQAKKIGQDAYANKIAAEAKKFNLESSDLKNGIDTILKIITWILLPVSILIVFNQLANKENSFSDAMRGMVAALIPMIPEGLVLMTSIAMMVGIIRLGKFNTLVNELSAIEGLARIDTICIDKTGTLTESDMQVCNVKFFNKKKEEVERALESFLAGQSNFNSSLAAISKLYKPSPHWEILTKTTFTSTKKYSEVSFKKNGSWVLGATEILLYPDNPIAKESEKISSNGMRVLLFGCSINAFSEDNIKENIVPCALITLKQKIRKDTMKTLEYFYKQRVDIKIISGDNALSVNTIAKSFGPVIKGGYISGFDLPENDKKFIEVIQNMSVFGRVTPEQKRKIVKGLQDAGKIVAMTGDGVNDVLALKSANVSIAMGAGSSITKSMSKIVLLDNKFSTLPKIVNEGRRVIGNIERVANLFLTKTIYSTGLALLIGIFGIPFPLLPRHITIVAWFTIGIPAFILSLSPNHEKANKNFVSRIMTFAIPAGSIIAVTSFFSYYYSYHASGSNKEINSSSTLVTLIMGAIWALSVVARPYKLWKLTLIVAMYSINLLIFLNPFIQNLLLIDITNNSINKVALICGIISMLSIELIFLCYKKR